MLLTQQTIIDNVSIQVSSIPSKIIVTIQDIPFSQSRKIVETIIIQQLYLQQLYSQQLYSQQLYSQQLYSQQKYLQQLN